MKAQTSTAADAGQRGGRRVSAATGQLPDVSAGRHRGRFSTGLEQRPEAPDNSRSDGTARAWSSCPIR